jgi:hypothetical protein
MFNKAPQILGITRLPTSAYVGDAVTVSASAQDVDGIYVAVSTYVSCVMDWLVETPAILQHLSMSCDGFPPVYRILNIQIV